MPKIFDGADFDIHELEEPLEPRLVTAKEKISKRMLEDLKRAIRTAKPVKKKKSLIVLLASNIVLPGLGSVYLKRTFVGISILAFNTMFLILGLSFFNILTHSFVYLPSVGFYSHGFSFGYAPEAYFYFPDCFVVLLWWSVLFTIAAWVHLAYLLVLHRGEFELLA